MTPIEMARRQTEYEAIVARHWADAHDGAHDIGHLRRVWRNCQRIARAEGCGDLDVLFAAAFFHDIVNLPKSSPDRARASARSAQFAVEHLKTGGFSPEKLDAVAHAIIAHSFSAGVPPTTPEAKILQDADRLEALGALGLARMFYVAGAMGRSLFDPDDPLAQYRPLNDADYALDHLETKLVRIAQTMNTAAGRDLAQEGAEWMAAYRTRLLREIV